MKSVEEILERIEDEIQTEAEVYKNAISANAFAAADRASSRSLLLEQLRDWITSDADGGEGGET